MVFLNLGLIRKLNPRLVAVLRKKNQVSLLFKLQSYNKQFLSKFPNKKILIALPTTFQIRLFMFGVKSTYNNDYNSKKMRLRGFFKKHLKIGPCRCSTLFLKTSYLFKIAEVFPLYLACEPKGKQIHKRKKRQWPGTPIIAHSGILTHNSLFQKISLKISENKERYILTLVYFGLVARKLLCWPEQRKTLENLSSIFYLLQNL